MALVLNGVRLPSEVWDMLRELAAREELNMADVVREAVLGYLDEHGFDVSPYQEQTIQIPRRRTGRRWRQTGGQSE